MWAGMWFCAACPSGGIGTFGGLITKVCASCLAVEDLHRSSGVVQGFGFSTFNTILMQIPTGAIGICALLLTIYITNRIKMRWPVLA